MNNLEHKDSFGDNVAAHDKHMETYSPEKKFNNDIKTP